MVSKDEDGAPATAGLAIVRDTKAALDAMGRLSPIHRAHAMRLGVELQALLEGQIDWVSKSQIEAQKGIIKKASPAMCCAAVMVCMQNGMSVGAGHVLMMGGKLYVAETGYLAAAQFARDHENMPTFKGFEPPEPIGDDERKMLGIADKTRYTCAIKVKAHCSLYDWPAVGYGWWDENKDKDSTMSVPSKKAHTRARRHALKQLFGLGSNPDDTPALGEEDSDMPIAEATVVEKPVKHIALKESVGVKDNAEVGPKGGRVQQALREMDEEDEDLTVGVGELLAIEDAAERTIAFKAFLRSAWRQDQDAVKAACKEAGVEPAKAQNLPDVEMGELVESVAGAIGEPATHGLVMATLSALREE